ncbi:MAG: sulfate/thiosulfate ABC transporter permease CysW, partial [Polyangiales bacterium]
MHSHVRGEPLWARWLLILTALGFLSLFVFAPLGAVFYEATKKGLETYWDAIADPDAQSALRLTLMAAIVAVPLNAVFGIAAAWAITKFEFRGKQLLITLIDLPFSVSPVISGLIYMLLFGAHGWFGEVLMRNGVKVVFALPGIVL